jgi:hypothetical protein
MKAPKYQALLGGLVLLGAAIAGGYYLAGAKNEPLLKVAAVEPALSSLPLKPEPGASAPATATTKAANPAIPQGDPVESYRAGRSAKERHNVISSFMALGHERNAAMLIDALGDADTAVRIFALESSTALEAAAAHRVLTQGCTNSSSEVRSMAWSLLGPYGIQEKAQTFAQVLIQGPQAAFDEAFQEMSISPERPLFETMLNATLHAEPQRHPRLLAEMQEWLERAGEVPKFNSSAELQAWWAKNQQHYDRYLLRLD